MQGDGHDIIEVASTCWNDFNTKYIFVIWLDLLGLGLGKGKKRKIVGGGTGKLDWSSPHSYIIIILLRDG